MGRFCRIGLMVLLLWAAAAGSFPLWAAAAPIKVAVSILPQKYFLEKIGGQRVDVSVMVEPGASPENYEPKPQQMVAIAKARAYFALGVPFESAWLKGILAANPSILLVHTDEGISKKPMPPHYHDEGASHADSKSLSHESEQFGKDPHIWLSPPLVMLQARNILHGLLKIDPDHGDSYEANYKSFLSEIADLDTSIINIFLRKTGNGRFIVFHPAWGYFADAYGLEQIPIEAEGKEPKPAELKELIDFAAKQGIKVVFVEPQFSTRSAKTLASAIGGQVVSVDVLALDWTKNLREVAQQIASALK